MNRRALLSSSVSLFVSAIIGQHQLVAASQDSKERPEPIVITPGLNLVDYRVVRLPNYKSMFLGEVTCDLDDNIDSPELIQTFTDADGNILGENRLWSVQGFMRPGESDYLVGPVNGYDPNTDEWDSFTFNLINDWPSQIQIVYTYDPGLVLEKVISEKIESKAYSVSVSASNVSDHDVKGGKLMAMFFNEDGRFSGYDETWLESTIPIGKKARMSLQVPGFFTGTYDPFQYLMPGEKFTVKPMVCGIAYD